ncbi:MAG: hypothetical protein ACLPN5_10085 [Roseiarcus sp.]
MASKSWHAFFYDGSGAVPPISSDWIEAESAAAAMTIARQRGGAWLLAELARPTWETPTPSLWVVNVAARGSTH